MINIRRTLLMTPAVEKKKIEKASSLDIDAVLIDLEDSIVPNEKISAREKAVESLKSVDFGFRERMVRINGIETEYWKDDLNAIINTELSSIMIPKVEKPSDIEQIEIYIDKLEEENKISRNIGLILTIETAKGLVNIDQICQNSRRIEGLFLGSGDYSMSTGIRICPESLQYPRSRLAVSAAARGVQAIDAAYFINVKDVDEVKHDSLLAKDLGFSGKVIFHPLQITPVNEVFTPTFEEIEKAKKIVSAYEKSSKEGVGVFLVDGEFVAIDIVRMAQKTLAIADKMTH